MSSFLDSEPTLAFDALLDALRAAGEPTRLRILALLADATLTVSDLTEILRQAQPRVSRHLKLLTDAGLIERTAEGAWAYFHLASSDPRVQVARGALRSLAGADPTLASDRERLAAIRAERAREAQQFFDQSAQEWDEIRRLHVGDERVEEALLDTLATQPYRSVLDIGTGTGRILELLGPNIERGLGCDISPRMLSIARNKLDQVGLRHCRVRQADLYALGIPANSFDVVVIHQVLHLLDDPAAALREAAGSLAAGGRLVIVDFAPHNQERLRQQFAHRRLGFPEEMVNEWIIAAGLDPSGFETLLPEADSTGRIAISIWLGRDGRAAATAATSAPVSVPELRKVEPR